MVKWFVARYQLKLSSPWLLLSLWIVLGLGLRLLGLTALPPWTDEVATLTFSLGNKFATVPVDQLISPQTLLNPLQFQAEAGIGDVVNNLLTESTHPPLYFILNHFWLQLFPSPDGYVSLWGARLLSVLLGVVAIPALFYLSRFAFKSNTVGHLSALLMAISPLGIFLAQKTRHYTLLILLVTASFTCFLLAMRRLQQRQSFPLSGVFTWIIINGLGTATHYFFPLAFCTQGLVLMKEAWTHSHRDGLKILLTRSWRRIYLAALGSVVTCLVWLPLLLHLRSNDATDWLFEIEDSNFFTTLIIPILQLILWTSSSLFLFPSQVYTLPYSYVIPAGLVMLAIWAFWILPLFKNGLSQQADPHLPVVRDYIVAALGLFLAITYILGMDLTSVARYQFVFFPVLLMWFGVALTGVWQSEQIKVWTHAFSGKVAVMTVIILGLIGSISTITHQGFLQNHRPDLFVDVVQETSDIPLAIVAPYAYHSHKGRMIGVAWDLRRRGVEEVQYALVTPPGVATVTDQLRQLSRPLDIWAVNLPKDLVWGEDCPLDPQYEGEVAESRYRLYRCRE